MAFSLGIAIVVVRVADSLLEDYLIEKKSLRGCYEQQREKNREKIFLFEVFFADPLTNANVRKQIFVD